MSSESGSIESSIVFFFYFVFGFCISKLLSISYKEWNKWDSLICMRNSRQVSGHLNPLDVVVNMVWNENYDALFLIKQLFSYSFRKLCLLLWIHCISGGKEWHSIVTLVWEKDSSVSESWIGTAERWSMHTNACPDPKEICHLHCCDWFSKQSSWDF